MDPPKILVVDDEPDVVQFLSDILTAEGFDVVVAYDGLNALDVAESESVDLVILDIMMPMMSGYEVVEQLRANGLMSDMPVLCLTSAHSIEARARSRQAGANGLIMKPCAPAELIANVRRLLEQAEPDTDR